jgi:hypothetical protein
MTTRCLKPAGYIEHIEFSPGTEEQGSSPGDEGNWGKEGIEAGERTGRTFVVMYHMYDWIRESGFQDVVEKRYQLPLGPWPKDKKLKKLGFWARAHADAGLENWSMALLTRVFGWSYEQVQAHIAKARERLWNRKRHAWHEMRVVYGMKPREREQQHSGTFA